MSAPWLCQTLLHLLSLLPGMKRLIGFNIKLYSCPYYCGFIFNSFSLQAAFLLHFAKGRRFLCLAKKALNNVLTPVLTTDSSSLFVFMQHSFLCLDFLFRHATLTQMGIDFDIYLSLVFCKHGSRQHTWPRWWGEHGRALFLNTRHFGDTSHSAGTSLKLERISGLVIFGVVRPGTALHPKLHFYGPVHTRLGF